MKLTCPTCETSYDIAAAAMPPEGRKVRCARCGNRWHAPASDAAPEAEEAGAATGRAETAVEGPVVTEEVQAPSAPTVPDESPSAVETPAELPPAAKPPTERPAEAKLVAAEMVEDPDGELPPFDDPDAPDQGRHSVEAAALRAARRVRVQRKPKSQSATHTLYGFVVGATLAMVVLAVQYREDVVRSMPQAAQIYRALGMQVNIRGLRFEALAPQRTVEDGVPTLVVEGKILNIRNEETEVPALHFVLRDSSGDEIYNWTIEPLQRVLERRGELPFRTRLASPPADAEAVELRFVERSLKQVGMRP